VLNENLHKSLMARGIGVHYASGRKDDSWQCAPSIATSSIKEATQLGRIFVQIVIEKEYAKRR
jgi:hypothetical protein